MIAIVRNIHLPKLTVLLSLSFLLFAHASSCKAESKTIVTGAEQTELYLPLLKNKSVALVVNHSSMIQNRHLIDTLLSLDVNVKAIFAPEHGLRGKADAGEIIKDGKDSKTSLPVFSLHGTSKKPRPDHLKNIDIVVFDMQDVGVRFYTYISTMHYVMESCAENGVHLIILDRPNPLGNYVDGPVLDTAYKSFVGMHPIPVVHGLTVGELAQMIQGEAWIANAKNLQLTIIKNKHWDHSRPYELPIKPSPNLPNQLSVYLYPSLCFFEATNISIGRGTRFPFQVYGYPSSDFGLFTFVPQSLPGMSTHPMHEGVSCHGVDLRELSTPPQFTLKYLLDAKARLPKGKELITRERWFNLLAGNDQLLRQINQGQSETEIRESWQKELNQYKSMRCKYLLYKDF